MQNKIGAQARLTLEEKKRVAVRYRAAFSRSRHSISTRGDSLAVAASLICEGRARLLARRVKAGRASKLGAISSARRNSIKVSKYPLGSPNIP
jgi:hypothetical protein